MFKHGKKRIKIMLNGQEIQAIGYGNKAPYTPEESNFVLSDGKILVTRDNKTFNHG